MIFDIIDRYKSAEFKSYENTAVLFANALNSDFKYTTSQFDLLEDFSYEQFLQSDLNQQFETKLRPEMAKYKIERVFIYRLLSENEYKYFANESEIKEYNYTENTPLDMKLLLEATVDDNVRLVRYDYNNDRYRYDFFDEDLKTQFATNDKILRNEVDKWGNRLIAHQKLYDDNHNLIGYLGVEINMVHYFDSVNQIYSITIGMLVVVGIILLLILLIILNTLKENKRKKILDQSSFKDSFTGLYNRYIRRKFKNIFGNDLKSTYAFMLIDIDNMAKINNLYGHKNGDELIKYVARVIKNQLRGEFDLPIYLGEDDFVVIIRDETIDVVMRIAKRIISETKQFKIFEDTSLSIGITTANIKELNDYFNVVFSRADAAIYEAKHSTSEYKIATRYKLESNNERNNQRKKKDE
jgi:diguanylate cyclase (GGDEF)-like protein